MEILDRYIGSRVILSIILVLFALVGVDVFFYIVNELRFVGKGLYTLDKAFIFVALTLPRKLYFLFPWAAMLGTLLALGSLNKTSEIVAMRVAGISILRICFAAIKGAILLTFLMIILGEIVAPEAEKLAQRKKTFALSSGQTIQTQYGAWVRNNNDFIHVGKVLSMNELKDVVKYSLDENLNLESVSIAESASKQPQNWILKNVRGTNFYSDRTEVIDFDQSIYPNLLDTQVLQATSVKYLERLSLLELWNLIKTRHENDLNAVDYERAFWVKIFQPIAVLVMVFLAVPFAFGPLRSSSTGLKILIGVLIGFGFHTLNSIFGPLTAVVNLSPLIAASLPSMLFFSYGILMLRKMN